MGLKVCAVDIDDGKLDHAKWLSADLVVSAKSGSGRRGEEGDRWRCPRRADHGALALGLQAGRRHDPQTGRLLRSEHSHG
jgi:hypothetical protein